MISKTRYESSFERRIRDNIRTARLARRMTLQAVAQKLGCADSQVYKTETGGRRIWIDELPDIAEALGVEVEGLLSMDNPRPAFTTCPECRGAGVVPLQPDEEED